MRLELTGRHISITPGVRKAVERRLAWMERKRPRGRPAAAIEPVEQGLQSVPLRVIRARRYAVKTMLVDDAALEIGAGAFLVFRNASTDTVNVLFRRPDGHLGLIEAEA